MNFRPVLNQLIDFIVVAYSFAVMASVIPALHRISGIELVPYYLFIPGFTITRLLSDSQRMVSMAFYSVVWSVVLTVSVSSLQSIAPQSSTLPIAIIVPAVTLVIYVYNHFHSSDTSS